MTDWKTVAESALEQLHNRTTRKGWTEWENAFAEWRTMSGLYATGERGAERARHLRTRAGTCRVWVSSCAGCREDERDRGAPGTESYQRSIRKRWSWNDRSSNRTYDGPSL
ncbi:MbeD/MobD family mobilization/exclusion protein [Pantoea stewartii]|uniref:MbeD/MobD family mobilization/exclusion protein n=1 Tax=Pantoea stewartii TaxID=66269 RepID=UPI003DA6F1EE